VSNADELLRIEGIRKTFPGVVALDGVDFDLRRGEVHVLLGENGAGKSTLIKMLSGAYTPDAGRILVGGEEVRIQDAQDSERLGIATIYQEFNLVPDLTVAENLFLGRQPRRFGVIDRKRMEADAEVLLARVGVNVSPRARVRELGIARLSALAISTICRRACSSWTSRPPCSPPRRSTSSSRSCARCARTASGSSSSRITWRRSPPSVTG
jgi:ribose transport system ATP-binding protein